MRSSSGEAGMKKKDLVWRELIDAAVERGERRWENVEHLAFRAGVAPATAAYALRRLFEIGALRQHHGGFTVVNPEKVLTSFCASRSIISDIVAVVKLGDAELKGLMDSPMASRLIVGGPEAAIAFLGGVNSVSDYHERIIYLRDENDSNFVLEHSDRDVQNQFERDRGNTTFLLADKRAARTWGLHTSFAQTYADLFATPGWQASEFRWALGEKFFGERDWDQG